MRVFPIHQSSSLAVRFVAALASQPLAELPPPQRPQGAAASAAILSMASPSLAGAAGAEFKIKGTRCLRKNEGDMATL